MNKGQNKKTKIKIENHVSFIGRHSNSFAFFITFCCCIVIFGIIAFGIIHFISPTTQASSVSALHSGSVSASPLVKISPSESFTMLIAVYSDIDETPVEFMLYRLDIAKKRTVVMPISLDLSVDYQGVTQSLSDIYKSNGIGTTCEILSTLLSVKINYKCNIGSGNFIKIFDRLGGIFSSVPQNLSFVMPDDDSVVNLTPSSNQYLSGQKIYALLAYSNYNGGQTQLYSVQSSLMKEFVSEKLSGFYLTNAINYYGNVFNLVDTDFSMSALINDSDGINAYSITSSIVTPKIVYVQSPSSPNLLQLLQLSNIKDYFD